MTTDIITTSHKITEQAVRIEYAAGALTTAPADEPTQGAKEVLRSSIAALADLVDDLISSGAEFS